MKIWLVALALAGAFLFALANIATPSEYPNCEGWINHSCCCTNECCSEVQPGEVRQIDSDMYQIVKTGQVIKRTGWSQNGKFMRCACDFDVTIGKWVKHPDAHTRCIYPPMPSS